MFEGEEIVLAVLNDSRIYDVIDEYKEQYCIIGIVTDSVQEFKQKCHGLFVPVYPYASLASNQKIIVLDIFWDDNIRLRFQEILNHAGLKFGINYTYETIQRGKIDTNLVYRLSGKDAGTFHKRMENIIGNKKFVIVHGNCQSHVVSDMLSGNKEFKDRFLTCVMPMVWERGMGQRERLELMEESGVFRFTDIFITQEVSDDNKFWHKFSTRHFISLMPASCEIIKISNLFFMGYFPQYKKMKHSPGVNLMRGKILDATEYMDINVIQMIIADKSDEEILKEIGKPAYYEKPRLTAAVEAELEDFKQREKTVEIKMHDYLMEHWDNDLLFATSNHPTKEVMMELTRRILARIGVVDMGLSCPDREIQEPMPFDWRYVVYPSVLRELGINRDLTYVFKAFLTQDEMGIIPEDARAFLELAEVGNGNYYVSIRCGFETYMHIYIRCIRAALMLL